METTNYIKLTRLGRNLRPGDEIIVGEDLGDGYRSGRVRVTEVRKVGRSYFGNKQEWLIYHTGPVAGNLRRHLWEGPGWGYMRVEASDAWDILRPRNS